MPHSHQINMFNKTRFLKKETQKTGQEHQLLHRIQIREFQHVPVKSISSRFTRKTIFNCTLINKNKFWCEWSIS